MSFYACYESEHDYCHETDVRNMIQALLLLVQEYVDKLTSMLGLKKVGWIFAHPTRETGYADTIYKHHPHIFEI